MHLYVFAHNMILVLASTAVRNVYFVIININDGVLFTFIEFGFTDSIWLIVLMSFPPFLIVSIQQDTF